MSELPSKHTFNISRAAEELVPNKANRNTYLVASLLALICLAAAGYFYRLLPDRIPLLLTTPWGEGRLAPKPAIFGGGALIVIIIALNITLGKLWGGGGSLIPRMLSIAALVFAVAITLGYWGVIQSFFL